MPYAISKERLRASPSFAQAFTMDGRPYVAKETEPYIQFWLTERYRVLLSLFSARYGATEAEVVDKYFRLTGENREAAEIRRVMKAIRDMREAGVVMSVREDVSRYDAAIVEAYVAHRPFPRPLSDLIIADGGIGRSSRVLDMAGGPGDLALALARVSRNVRLMELSRGFVRAARQRADQLRLPLDTHHESCNRLMFQDDTYDAITISQALHWLDDVLICRGVCRVLNPGGSFFVIHGSIDLPRSHPLSYILGDDSVLGAKDTRPYPDQIEALRKRLALLFEALDSPDVARVDPAQRWVGSADGSSQRIACAKVSLFRQSRPFGPGYARAFLTDAHIAATGLSPDDFWADLEARCAAVDPAGLQGHQDWAVLQFSRGAAPVAGFARDASPIGYGGPVT